MANTPPNGMTTPSISQAIFIYTSAFVALLAADDEHHEAAGSFWAPLADTVVQETTWGAVSETYTGCRVRTRDDRLAGRWLDQVEAGESIGYPQALLPDQPRDRLARSSPRKFSDQNPSYVDAVSLAVPQVQEIDAAFPFDRQLSLGGVPLLPGSLGS